MDNVSSQHIGQQDFNLPHDVVQLPSGGLFYKNRKKSVKIGYLTASDENIIMSGFNIPNKESIILSLIRNKMYETDIRPEDLLESDVEAILIFLRNTSFGSEYTFNLNDPNTDKQFSTTVNLDELNITRTEVQPEDSGLLFTTLPRSGSSVKLKPLTFSEIVDINKMVDQYPQGRVAPKVSWRLSKQIVELDGSQDRAKISQFSESMPIMDSKYIRDFMEKNVPKLDLKKEIITPSGEKVSVNITFGVEFFRPFF